MGDRYGDEVLRNIFLRSSRQRDTRLCMPAPGRSQKSSKSSASRMGVLTNISDFFLDIISFLRYFTPSLPFALFYIIFFIYAYARLNLSLESLNLMTPDLIK